MEVWCGEPDVPERRDLEHILVALGLSYGKSPLVARRPDRIRRLLHEAEREISSPADVDAVMTPGAPLVHEQVEPRLLVIREGGGIPFYVFIERGIGRKQSRFERLDRFNGVVERYRVGFSRERLVKNIYVYGHALERLYDAVGRVAHLDRRLHGALCLLLQVLRAAVPELRYVEYGVKDGGRVARPFLPLMPDRRFLKVNAPRAHVVACIAAYEVRRRESRVEIEHLPELDLFGRNRVFLVFWCNGRYRFEQRGRLFHRLVFCAGYPGC